MKTWLLAAAAIVTGSAIGLATTAAFFGMWGGPAKAITSGLGDSSAGSLRLPPPGAPQARLELEGDEYDFGIMERGAKQNHAFTFKNEGDGELEVRLEGVTCHCTTTSLTEHETVRVAPHSSLDVTLEWQTKGQTDHFKQSATIRTNDPKRQTVVLTIKGKVMQSLRLVPEELIFTRVTAGEPAEANARLYSLDHEQIELLERKFSDPSTTDLFEVEATPLSDKELEEGSAKGGLLLTVRVKPGLPVGGFAQDIDVTTDVAGRTTLVLRVKGTVSGPIEVYGRGWVKNLGVLNLEEVPRDKGEQRELRMTITGPGAKDVTLSVGARNPEQLKATLGERKVIRDERVEVPLVVEVPRGAGPMSYLGWEPAKMGMIVIETSHPLAKQVKLYVRFAVVP